jgi:hypothetical protein
MKKDKNSKKRGRNWLAVHAHNRRAGAMPDKKKQQNKNACRGQVDTKQENK